MFYVLALPVVAASKSTGILAGSFDFYGSGCFACPVPGGMQKRCVYESVDSGNRHRSGSVWPVFVVDMACSGF